MLRNAQPLLSFKSHFTKGEMEIWKNKVKLKMEELMNFPIVPPQPVPKLLNKQIKDGYTLEKWEIYPQPGSVVPFFIMIPDGVSKMNPGPAVLCFTGSAGTKETLVGEENIVPIFTPPHPDKNKMALFYVKQGIISVVVDHPGVGESSDLERFKKSRGYDRGVFSTYLLDLGWSYLGLSAFQGQQILNWMKNLEFVNKNRIALSGHSLGTEPAMVLAVMNPDICAVVYNDFMCRWLEREKVLTKPDSNGTRPYYSGLIHFPPGTLKWFDYPDIVASLAPRPVILTEGGAESDLNLIKYAFGIMGASDSIAIYHYPKYKNPKDRKKYDTIPEGLNLEEYFQYENVDAPNHYFKSEVAVPWLKGILFK